MTARRTAWGKARKGGPREEVWIVDFWHEQPDGKRARVRERSPVNTKRGAEQHERDLRAAFQNPRPKAKEVPTLRVFAKEFMETYAKVNNRESEQEGKQSILNRHLLPRFGRRRLDGITVRDIERMKADLMTTHKPRTINNIMAVLGKILRYAAEVEELEKVPRFKFLKVPPQPYNFLDFEEYEMLVTSAMDKDHQLAVAVLLAGEAGLRRGELAGLQWQDINLQLNKLTVMRALWRGKVVPPKGDRARPVPLTDRLARALKAHRHLRSKYVLVRDDNKPWSVEVFRWQGPRAYRLASLPEMDRPWHSLRHTFCSLLAMRGASPKAIQELAGHQQITTTMRYMHLAPKALTDAIDLLNLGSSWAAGQEAKK